MTAPARVIPACFAHLPVDPVRGVPVPFTSGRDPATGEGRFGVNDPDAKLACALAEWCGMCGRDLYADPVTGERLPGVTSMVFLAVDHDADPARVLFTDPPNHERCAAEAMTWCPFIGLPRVPRRDGQPADKPAWLWLTCAGYELHPGPAWRPAVRFVFRPAGITAVRRFTYDGPRGALTEAGVR